MRRNSCWLKGIEELNGIVDDLFGIWHCVHGFIASALSRQHVQSLSLMASTALFLGARIALSLSHMRFR